MAALLRHIGEVDIEVQPRRRLRRQALKRALYAGDSLDSWPAGQGPEFIKVQNGNLAIGRLWCFEDPWKPEISEEFYDLRYFAGHDVFLSDPFLVASV